MDFGVKLLRVPPIDQLSGWDVFELMVNARHVGGDFWVFEGDTESLSVADMKIVGDGITEGYGDLNDEQLTKHCEEIFDVVLSFVAPAWKMLSGQGR